MCFGSTGNLVGYTELQRRFRSAHAVVRGAAPRRAMLILRPWCGEGGFPRIADMAERRVQSMHCS